MIENTGERRSYLLRLWAVQVNGHLAWRAALVCIPDGEERGFRSLESLFEHLRLVTITAKVNPIQTKETSK
ncbi:MAG: hypothetical protein AB1894_23740 [Chloroflexota bacterium]